MWVLHPTTIVNMRSEFSCCLCFQVLRHNRTIILSYLFKAFLIQKVPEAFKFWIRLVFAYTEFSEKSYYILHTHTHIFPTRCYASSASLLWSFKMQYILLFLTLGSKKKKKRSSLSFQFTERWSLPGPRIAVQSWTLEETNTS